ncbi:EAL domain-containing protein [Marinobacter daepoensis]|uniref:EAL domain-containing protein n=1 Tax=Marinobacter daepoensis TaxID=262077 RepID=UPI001C940C6A|nr:EAL domain-containing protein [Marinobacter daepoensis]MBY6033762.1 EAL domain-containing protein [Marinobacter daepoensis]
MDSPSLGQTPDKAPSPGRIPARFHHLLPFLVLFAAIGYGLANSFWQTPPKPTGTPVVDTNLSLPPTRLSEQIDYLTHPLDKVLEEKLWRSDSWTETDRDYSGIGYPYQPATFRLTVENDSPKAVHRHIIVPAPYLDHVEPALIHPNGEIVRLPIMGDRYPFDHRYLALPQWVWPVTLPPGTSTLLIEIRNHGPVVLPITLSDSEKTLSHGAASTAWRAFVAGSLAFALLLNLSIVVKLRRPGLAWLSVLMISVIYSQLVMDGLGLWLIWPRVPELNTLLNISLPLCLIALSEFTPHFLQVSRTEARILRAFSLLAGLHLLAAPMGSILLGQHGFLVTSSFGGLYIFALSLCQLKSHIYARYYALSVLSILVGAMITSLRTIGWLPVNTLTDSAFFLGAATGSLILTSGVGKLLLEERKKRLSSDIRAQEEQKLRTRIERDYDRLLRTHRVTGKPNRPMLEEALGALDCERTPYTLCMIRLARFNELEQALGYRIAEDLLKHYLTQLNRYLIQAFGDQLVTINGNGVATLDTVNHAFALLRHPDDTFEQNRLKTISQWLSENFREGRLSFSWAASIGVAHAPEHGTDPASVLASAGFASRDDSTPLVVYDPAIAEWQYRQQLLMLDVEEALKSGDMWLEYQPKVNIRDGRTVSFEALIRWRHPEFGRVAPDQWIPLAEEFGIIHTVTLWVLDRACRDSHPLRAKHGQDLSIAVNVSAKDLAHSLFHEEAGAIVRRHKLEPANITLEITETAMMSDPETARATLHTLSTMGFRIALDDFGSGHSSLGALAQFELDELKIDRSFLEGVLDYPARQKIMIAAMELGTSLDLDVVVEGVEDEAIALWLHQFPGLHGQGYYWGRPFNLRLRNH